jgi:phospholipid transport system substrate-binding protein
MPPRLATQISLPGDSVARPNDFHVPTRRQILGYAFTSSLVVATGSGVSSLFSSDVSAATSPQGAANFVQWLAGQALEVLRSPNATMSDRERMLRQLLASGFDLKFIGRFVLGRNWRKLSPAQRDAYTQVYSTFFLNTYSARFGGYNGQKFSVLSARGAGKKDAVVKTRIDRPGGAPLTSDWRIRAAQNQFRIIDISVEGVSMAVTQRSEFASVIKNGGIEGLMAALRARTDKISVISSN